MTLLHACLHHLCQARQLLDRVDDSQYAMPHAHCFGSSIGGHIRHCLDHYSLFLRGVEGAEINYDMRERDEQLATCVKVAQSQITEISAALESLENQVDDDSAVMVRVDCGGDACHWKRSSVGRELQFLASHTVHHFAIIGIMCNAMELTLDPGFGLAPSTIKHQATA